MLAKLASIVRGRFFVAVVLIVAVMAAIQSEEGTNLLLATIFVVGSYEAVSMFLKQNKLQKWLAVPLVLFLLLAMIVASRVRTHQEGYALFFQLTWAIWIFDSFALFTGKIYHEFCSNRLVLGIKIPDTHKIWKAASPNKSWEGFIGGAVFGLVSIALSGVILSAFDVGPAITLRQHALWVLLLLSWAHVGDFLESLLKRKLGVKDSGKILQGHGGVLDRFDGFIFIFIGAYLLQHLHLL